VTWEDTNVSDDRVGFRVKVEVAWYPTKRHDTEDLDLNNVACYIIIPATA